MLMFVESGIINMITLTGHFGLGNGRDGRWAEQSGSEQARFA